MWLWYLKKGSEKYRKIEVTDVRVSLDSGKQIMKVQNVRGGVQVETPEVFYEEDFKVVKYEEDFKVVK
jgi:hypothetical protein